MLKRKAETYYEILGIDECASDVVIQEAYSKLKVTFELTHDLFLLASQNFSINQPCSSKLQEAYETLMNPIRREAYDALLAEDELHALSRNCSADFPQHHFERDYLIPDLPITQ